MKKIEILGTGCPKCKKLYEATCSVVNDTGLDAEVLKVEDIQQIVARGVMMTPALVVDGKVVLTGKVPSPTDLERLLAG